MVGMKFFVRLLFIVSRNTSVLFANDPLKEFPNTFQCSQCREVVEKGFQYKQNGIESAISSVDSWSACAEQCRKTATCKYWSYFTPTSKCIPKTLGEGRRENSEVISGNRRCGDEIISATADFTQSNLCGFKAPGLKGYRLENGDFIFSWQKGSRRMVLTDNQGQVKKWGAVQYGVATWQDPSTWITYDNRQYTVTNFKGQKHSSVCNNCTEIIEDGICYISVDLREVKNVLTMEECKDLCTSVEECTVFSYKKDVKRCYLKKGKRRSSVCTDCVSGTQACYGYISNIPQNNDDKTTTTTTTTTTSIDPWQL